MSDHHDYLQDARAAVAGEEIRQAMADGTVTFGDYEPAEAERILAALPDVDLDATTVPTSIRLPYPLHRRLRAYAEEHGTTATTLIQEWVEQMLTAGDRPISLADAVRVLSTLPSRGDRRAA